MRERVLRNRGRDFPVHSNVSPFFARRKIDFWLVFFAMVPAVLTRILRTLYHRSERTTNKYCFCLLIDYFTRAKKTFFIYLTEP